jgi:transposase
MEFKLSAQDKDELEHRHRAERDGPVRDRIKAVLLKAEGWENSAIAQALRIHRETVGTHQRDWQQEQKLKSANGGSQSKLSEEQTRCLDAHLQSKTYLQVSEICAYVLQTFGVEYTVSGMTKWLHNHGFSYKEPKLVPAKADTVKQEQFIEQYIALHADKPSDEPIVFIDAVHPTMATKVSCGWIKKGVNKPLQQTASRTRINVIGAIELQSMNVVSEFVETVNSQTVLTLLQSLKAAYPAAPKIHVVLDQSGYHTSQVLKDGALLLGIELHYLPPYSPNLNPIERLWKVMNEHARNNVFFESATAFKTSIEKFFKETVPNIRPLLFSRINDNFQTLTLPTAPSG